MAVEASFLQTITFFEDLTEDALLRMNQRVAGSKSVEEVLGNHMPASSRTFR